MRPLRFACLFVILISTMLPAQSNPVPPVDQPKAMPVAQKPNLAVAPNLSQMLQGLLSDRHGNMLRTTQRPRGSSPQPSGVTFAPIVTYGSGGTNGAQWVTVADVNGDGRLDLLVANSGACCTNGGVVGVLLGNGDGTFQAAVAYGSSGSFAAGSYSVAVADVNGDGKLDLVVANFCPDNSYSCGDNGTDGAVGVLLGNGDGTFQTAVGYDSGGGGALSVAVGDLNGDGIPDVLVGNQCFAANLCESDGEWSVLLGNGDGTFQSPLTFESGYFVNSVAIADMNGDGKLDAVFVWLCGTLGECSSGSGGGVGEELGYLDRSFSVRNVDNSGGFFPDSVAVADVNGDGKLDLLVANQYPQEWQV